MQSFEKATGSSLQSSALSSKIISASRDDAVSIAYTKNHQSTFPMPHSETGYAKFSSTADWHSIFATPQRAPTSNS